MSPDSHTPTRAKRLRLGERLVRDGLVTESQLRTALQEQQRTGTQLGQVLVSMGFLREERLSEILAEDLGVPFVRLHELTPDPELLLPVAPEFARQNSFFPIRREGDAVVVALARPADIISIDAIKQRLWRNIEVVAAAPRDIGAAIARHLESLGKENEAPVREAPTIDVRDNPTGADVVAITNRILERALRSLATDIHIEPEENLLRVRYRVDGMLEQGDNLAREIGPGVIARIKIMSGLDITERRLPQDGRIRFPRDRGAVDMRVSIMPTSHGENAVLRVLDRSAVSLDLEELGIAGTGRDELESSLQKSSGMLLVSGPTGSGKTTTLYSLLLSIDSLTRKIVTVEDPIEYQLPLIRQSQIDASIGYHFADGLRAILRQDPDVILVGEIRDGETADIALKASLTGHLVLSSIHTNSSVGVVTRLLDLGVDRYLIASSLTGAMAQRLVRRVCSLCRQEREATAAEASFLGLGDARPKLFEGRGCRACRGSGFSGRLAVFDLFRMDRECSGLVASGSGEHELVAAGERKGRRQMIDDAREKVLSGLTTVTEVLRVCPQSITDSAPV